MKLNPCRGRRAGGRVRVTTGTEWVGDTPVGWMIANQAINAPIFPRMLPETVVELILNL